MATDIVCGDYAHPSARSDDSQSSVGPPSYGEVVASIQQIKDEVGSASLAELLNGDTRKRPVAVVTIPAGREGPWIDVDELAREAGGLADVYLLPTGPLTWEFSKRMAEGTQVYGGAGRVYPVGHDWTSDLSKSPLRFAFNAADGHRACQHLISDMFRMAAAAGLLQRLPARQVRAVRGVVLTTIAGRALVDIGSRFPAAVPQELTAEDVQIDRIVIPGQEISGLYDQETNRIDVTRHLRPASEALEHYRVGDVVLSRVANVRRGRAELVLYPKTSSAATVVTVLRAAVTENPADDLQTLMTPGEAIPARVTSTAPAWALILNDIDDDEAVLEAPSLLDGGPPWLVEDSGEPELGEPLTVAPPAPSMPSPQSSPAPEREVVDTPHPAQPRPTPALLDRGRAEVAPHPASHQEQPASTKALLLKIDGLAAEVAGARREADQLRGQLLAAADEREQLLYLLDQAQSSANRAESSLKTARARLRKAGNRTSAVADDAAPQFADPEEGFRYLVLTQWALRTLPGEQRDRPLGEYVIGPGFLDSLEKLEGIKSEKVADVVFEIVTGLARRLPGREVHHLRTGTGGEDPARTRDDGAVAWRASLQVNTPSARRIHYWQLPGDRIELARVATHDDFDM